VSIPEDLKRAERLLAESRAGGIERGAFQSPLDLALEEADRRIQPRHDFITSEAIGRKVMFLRQQFSEYDILPWKGTDGGDTHPDSAVWIGPQVTTARDGDLAKPSLTVRSGPITREAAVSGGGLKHWSARTGERTYTMLTPGTLQIMASAKDGDAVNKLAGFVAMTIDAGYSNLCGPRGFHSIQNISESGFDRNNPAYNRGTNAVTHAVAAVNISYFWQRGFRVSTRDRTYEQANVLYAALRRDVDESSSSVVVLPRAPKPLSFDSE
jgi:hypothetical protein